MPVTRGTEITTNLASTQVCVCGGAPPKHMLPDAFLYPGNHFGGTLVADCAGLGPSGSAHGAVCTMYALWSGKPLVGHESRVHVDCHDGTNLHLAIILSHAKPVFSLRFVLIVSYILYQPVLSS